MRYNDVLRFISDYIDENQMPPTMREIQEGMTLSSTSITRLRIVELADDGYIAFVPKLARTIRITEKGKNVLNK